MRLTSVSYISRCPATDFFSLLTMDALNGKAGRAQTFLQAMQGFFGGVARGSDTLRPCRGFPASQKTSPFLQPKLSVAINRVLFQGQVGV